MVETSVESNSDEMADDFGEFASVEATSTDEPTAALDSLLDLGVEESPEKQQPEADVAVENGAENDLRNFDPSKKPSETAEPSLMIEQSATGAAVPDETTPPLESEDPFGDFIATPLAVQETETIGGTTDMEVSEYGASSRANSVQATPAASDDGTEPPAEEDVDFDNFGQEHGPTPVETTVQLVPGTLGVTESRADAKELALDDDDDEFGGFVGDSENGHEVTADPNDCPPPSTEVTSPVMNDFGDFVGDSVNGLEVKPNLNGDPTTSIEVSPPIMDDFGDFNGAPLETTESLAVTENESPSVNDGTTPKTLDVATSAPEEEHDAFGAFDDFQVAPITSEEIPQDTVTTASKVEDLPRAVSSEVAGDDDFGDFGDFNDAPVVTSQDESNHQTPVVPAATVAPDDDDDFGDFGDFTDGPQIASSEITAPVPPAASSQDNNNDDDDDFGDFGDFNDAPQDTAPAPSGPVVENHDDDFGNFDSVEATPVAAVVPQPPPAPVHDPFLNQVKGVFAQVFGNDTLDTTDEAKIDDSTDAPMMLKDVLTELLSEGKDPEDVTSHWANQQILSILGSIKMIKKLEPTVILDKHAVHPYSHYSHPAEAPRVDMTVTESSTSKRRTLSIDFPEDDENEDTSSADAQTVNETTDNSPGEGDATATIVSIPEAPADVKLDFTDFKAPSVNDDSGVEADNKNGSSAAKLFLQQIPDLSFMLSSELILPREQS